MLHALDLLKLLCILKLLANRFGCFRSVHVFLRPVMSFQYGLISLWITFSNVSFMLRRSRTLKDQNCGRTTAVLVFRKRKWSDVGLGFSHKAVNVRKYTSTGPVYFQCFVLSIRIRNEHPPGAAFVYIYTGGGLFVTHLIISVVPAHLLSVMDFYTLTSTNTLILFKSMYPIRYLN